MTSQQLELIARRGLTLPEPTLTRLRTVGIWCEANLTVQRRDQDWLIRGQESGGAVNDIGRYVGFCKEDGSPLSWLQPVKNFMPNGLLRHPAGKRADRTIDFITMSAPSTTE
jgi:hypothetical protein